MSMHFPFRENSIYCLGFFLKIIKIQNFELSKTFLYVYNTYFGSHFKAHSSKIWVFEWVWYDDLGWDCVSAMLLSWILGLCFSWFMLQQGYLCNQLSMSFSFSSKMCWQSSINEVGWWMYLPSAALAQTVLLSLSVILIGKPKIKRSGTNITSAIWSPLVG